MSQWGGSSALRSLRSIWFSFLVPLGVAALAATVATALGQPHWLAAGAAYVAGFGKNVEALAVAVALGTGLATRALLAVRPAASAVRLGILLQTAAAAGWVALATRVRWPDLLAAAPLLLAALLLAHATVARWPVADAAANPVPQLEKPSIPAWLAAAVVAFLALLELVAATEPLAIDVFHHGEVLASALDLIAGGRPFATYIWPHGLHDTGLTALFVLATGKIATSPVALARAAVAALGVVAAYSVARALLSSRGEALAATTGLALGPLLLTPAGGALAAAATLGPLGILVFVALALRTLVARRRGATLLAGFLLGLAHLFRIEAGLFAAVAAGALVAVRHLADRAAEWPLRLRRLAADAVRLVLGFAAALAFVRVALGFPGLAWFEAALLDLPRYHRDATGLLLPWPIAGSAADPERAPVVAIAIAWLLFAFGLGLAAIRALVEHARRPDAASRRHAETLAFVAAFALLATRSALERFDAPHVLQWAALPLFAALSLAFARLRRHRGWSARRSSAALALAMLLFGATGLVFALPLPRDPIATLRQLAARAELLGEQLAPNPSTGPCADRSFTAAELEIPWNRRFVAATCEVEELLERRGVERLAIADSAPWYWVRFGMGAPTRFFAHARAYTPRHQLELIEELRASGADALLRPRGFLALREFDVPEPVRLPVAEAYLRARSAGAPSRATAIGQVYFWNEPERCLPPPSATPAGELFLRVNRLFFQPASGLLFARGRAETTTGEPLAALHVAPDAGVDGDVDYGDLRPASDGPAGSKAPVGFEALFALPPGDAPSEGALRLQAVLPDGGRTRVDLDPAAAVRLGPLTGDSWRDLAAAVRSARDLGRRDREAVAGRPCPRDAATPAPPSGMPPIQGDTRDQ